MDWETYRTTYRNYVMATSQIQIVTLLAAESVKDFPHNLPKDLRTPLMEGITQLGESIRQLLQADKKKKASKKYHISTVDDPTKGKLLQYVVTLFATQIDPQRPSDIDERVRSGFERLLMSQQLVMLYAHLDAFMADTLRAICSMRPEILKREKKIEWSTALAFESKDELLGHLTERYVFEYGWLPLSKRLDFLVKEVGLKIEPPKTELQQLKWAENVRHIAVHNGGRISSEFLERTGNTDLVIGQLVPISASGLEEISNAAILLAGDLFTATSQKFFGIEPNKLTAVIGRGKRQAAPRKVSSGKAKARRHTVKKTRRP